MTTFRPFRAFRPTPEKAGAIASRPYDVLNSAEARVEVKGNPLSFLHVGKPEVDLDPSIDLHDPRIYQKGRDNLQKLINDGNLAQDAAPHYYLYAQTMDGRTQCGFVGCASVEEYWNNTIKKHELTRKDKEEDRCAHVRVTNAHSGPIFLTFRDTPELAALIEKIRQTPYANDHTAADGIRHTCWVVSRAEDARRIETAFKNLDFLYIADGHHRSAAAGIAGMERKKANPNHRGDEEYNFFLAVAFSASQLKILDYNRVVKDLNGLSEADFLARLAEKCAVEPRPTIFKPASKGQFGMFLRNQWFVLTARPEFTQPKDPVENLDVAFLQREILTPLLGIADPRTSTRIDFVGGIRGLNELEKRVQSGEMAVAFALFPTSVNELMSIADAGQIMPPKSTWFEPKLRDGLFVHFLD